MVQLYVAYYDYGDDPVRIQILVATEYDKIQALYSTTARLYVVVVPIKSLRTGEPMITIFALSEFNEFDPERTKQIKWEVLVWLMKNGHMPKW